MYTFYLCEEFSCGTMTLLKIKKMLYVDTLIHDPNPFHRYVNKFMSQYTHE